MSNTNTGGPAFPQDYEHTKVLVQMQQDGDIGVEDFRKLSKQLAGMTLRDYFAAKAMQQMVNEYEDFDFTARTAYELADSMLKARKQ